MLRPRSLLFALVAIVALAALYRHVERYDPARRDAQDAGAGGVRLVIEDARMAGTSGGRPDWRLRANRIVLRAEPGSDLDAFRQVELEGIREGELLEGGRKRAAFQADRAVYDQGVRQFTIRGDIRLVSARGDRIVADECLWSERDDYVRFPSGARGEYRGNRVRAPSLLYTPRQRRILCPLGAEGTFNGYVIRAAAIAWDVARGWVHCTGPVSGSRRNLDFQAASADLDLASRTLRTNKGVLHLRTESESEEPEALP
jgi:hypothetical protein